MILLPRLSSSTIFPGPALQPTSRTAANSDSGLSGLSSLSGRSASPTKTSALTGLLQPIKYTQVTEFMSAQQQSLPQGLQSLVEQVDNFADGFGIIPVHLKVRNCLLQSRFFV